MQGAGEGRQTVHAAWAGMVGMAGPGPCADPGAATALHSPKHDLPLKHFPWAISFLLTPVKVWYLDFLMCQVVQVEVFFQFEIKTPLQLTVALKSKETHFLPKFGNITFLIPKHIS